MHHQRWSQERVLHHGTHASAINESTGHCTKWWDGIDPCAAAERVWMTLWCKPGICLQGVWLRDYEPVNTRKEGGESVKETLGEVKPSNAYKRRIAGTNWQ